MSKIKTWMYECSVVAFVLIGILIYKGFSKAEVICSLAVFFTFLHAQVADRMQEKQRTAEKPDVECYKMSNRYFIIKEFLWISFFLIIENYAALAGAFIFIIYPFWRVLYRKIKAIPNK